VTRMVVAAAALLKALAIAGPLFRLTEPGWLRLPVFPWLAYPSAPAVVVLLCVWVLAAAGLLAGWRTRACGGVLTGCLAVPLLLDEQLYSNHLYLLAVLVGLLTVADSGARWSVDARRHGWRQQVAAWPVVALRAMLPIVYGFAALAKVNLVYLSGGVLAASLRTEGLLAVPPGLRMISVMAPIALASVVLEAFLAAAFLRPRWRRAGVALGLTFHLSVIAVLAAPLELIIFAMAMVALYPLFFAPRSQATARESPAAPATAVGAVSQPA
jgi:vitamin K-dependent gamma-carboxylase